MCSRYSVLEWYNLFSEFESSIRSFCFISHAKAVLECQKQMATKVWWMQIERDEMGDFVVMEMREWNSSSKTGREALRQMESRLKKSS